MPILTVTIFEFEDESMFGEISSTSYELSTFDFKYEKPWSLTTRIFFTILSIPSMFHELIRFVGNERSLLKKLVKLIPV